MERVPAVPAAAEAQAQAEVPDGAVQVAGGAVAEVPDQAVNASVRSAEPGCRTGSGHRALPSPARSAGRP